eukprot:386857-Amphidinium_carterae.1
MEKISVDCCNGIDLLDFMTGLLFEKESRTAPLVARQTQEWTTSPLDFASWASFRGGKFAENGGSLSSLTLIGSSGTTVPSKTF